MAIVKMKKMHVFGLKKDRLALLDVLQKMGVAEIIDQTEENEARDFGKEIGDIEFKLDKVKFAIDLLRPLVKEPNPILTGKMKIKKEELFALLNEEADYFAKIEKLGEYDKKLSQLKSEETRINNQLESLKPWEKLDIPLQYLGETQKTKFLAGSILKRAYEGFALRCKEEDLPLEVLMVSEGKDEYNLLIVFHKNAEEKVEGILKEYSVSIHDFSQMHGTPSEVTNILKQKLAEIEVQRAEIHKEIGSFTEMLTPLKVLFDYYNVEKEKRINLYKAQDTESSFYLQAWVPEPKIEEIRNRLLKVTDAIFIDFEEPKEDENFPVLLSNPRWVQPFELVTELYSLPDPRGIDPNIFMAPFYFMFFGMMVSDAGYGLVLALLAGIAMKKT